MILADKIMNERKRMGLSQEELADMLDVSRQSVSKWESAQSTPDLNRIIKMAEIFGVTTDYLLKDEIEHKDPVALPEDAAPVKESVRKVSMEEATEYLKVNAETTPKIAWGVSLCIGSPIILLIMTALTEAKGISETLAVAIGVPALLVMVAIAVFTFIMCGRKLEPYEYLKTKEIETAYGVDGMVREKQTRYEKTFTMMVAGGVVLCIIAVIPVLITGFMLDGTGKEYIIVYMVALLLAIIATGVQLMIRGGATMDAYKALLQEGDYSMEGKKATKFGDKIGAIYWPIVVAIYLLWSFLTMRWEITWLVWPVAGVLFGAICGIAKAVMKEA